MAFEIPIEPFLWLLGKHANLACGINQSTMFHFDAFYFMVLGIPYQGNYTTGQIFRVNIKK